MSQTDAQVIPLTAEQKRLQNAVARELWDWRQELHRRADQWYPEDVFPPAPKGEAHRTVDAAAAAMARHILRLIAQDIGERSIELTHDDAD